LPDIYAQEADRLSRFTRKAQVLASLNRPKIATIFGIKDRAIVMELVERGPLPFLRASRKHQRQIGS
jgi:hypothetical protein